MHVAFNNNDKMSAIGKLKLKQIASHSIKLLINAASQLLPVMNQTQQQSIHNRIRDRRISVFGHVRRLQESVPAHEALRLVVISRAGHRPDDRSA